jgi:hypothetical protein
MAPILAMLVETDFSRNAILKGGGGGSCFHVMYFD